MADPAQELTKPERFGRYVLLDRIGTGGMAEVYRAVMPGAEGFRRTFVVKRILGRLSQSASFVEMFVREARICGLLNHPTIVQVYDFGNVDGNYFLAMEYVRGRDLQAVLRRARQARRPFPVSAAAFITREVAECLGYAHALKGEGGRPLNIIHRDVSPSNIMCASAGGVKLLDFGIAESLGEDPSARTETGAFKGKLSYMAPERVKRDPIDGRSDLFSLGVVLWEMLAGRRLFRTKVDVDTLKNVLEAPVPLLSSLRTDIPPELEAIVMRALARDPAERYATGTAMAEDLDEVVMATKHHPKILPNLLRELFGSGLQSLQIPISSEMFDNTPVSAAVPAEAVLEIAPLAPAAAVEERTVATPAPAAPWTWQRLSAGAFAVAATATLGVLLFGRGGGGRSHAMTLVEREHVAALPSAAAAERGPPAVPIAMEPIVPVPSAPVTAPASMPTSKRAETPVVEARASRSTRPRPHPERDRIARGLSIDPFAEAARRAGR